MQSIVKYATAAALLVGQATAIVARLPSGNFSAPVTFTIDANSTITLSTYNNGEALSLIEQF
jgi:hypothetical protein